MTTILRFEKDGVEYAKGFVNQEGLSMYVLPGYKEALYEALEKTSLCALEEGMSLEESSNFPGEPYPPGTVAQ